MAIEQNVFSSFASEVQKKLEEEDVPADSIVQRRSSSSKPRLSADERTTRTGYHRVPLYASKDVRG